VLDTHTFFESFFDKRQLFFFANNSVIKFVTLEGLLPTNNKEVIDKPDSLEVGTILPGPKIWGLSEINHNLVLFMEA